jgi:hypothetical protein
VAGTISGGKLAAQTNMDEYDYDFFKRIGSMRGSKGRTDSFASDKVGPDGPTGRQRARIVGAKGGRIRQRLKAAA